MRLIFINNAHPNTPHVSGMRLFFFAKAMSRRGHQVILLTDADPTGVTSPPRPGGGIADAISTHDWSEPLVLAVPATSTWSTEAARQGRLPIFLRKVVTAWNFVVHGGVFPGWTKAIRCELPEILAVFSPELIWATFGNTSNLTVAQHIARVTGCPWIIDVKDNWEAFIPSMLRRYMAWRFRSAAALSGNAEHHLSIARRWHRQTISRVVYSGVADCLFTSQADRAGAEGRYLFMIGATYSEATLRDYFRSLRIWLDSASGKTRRSFRFRYAGSDSFRVRQIVREFGFEGIATIEGQLPLERMADLVRGAVACSYLWAPFTFHHKLLELLVAARLVIVYPGEHSESIKLAGGAPTPLRVCRNRESLCAALQSAWEDDVAGVCEESVAPAWRWTDFADGLDELFVQAAGLRRDTSPRESR